MSEYGRIAPLDAHNRTLLARVHPEDWRNPEPAPRYNLVVIGAGTAGLVTANIAASLGGRVALVERHLMGGDCLNVGCVPSKAVIRSARLAADARRAAGLGLPLSPDALPDFGAAMERMREVRARIAEEDSVERYSVEVGVDVFLGEARFTASNEITVGDRRLRFARAVVATGARAAMLPIPGLAEAEPLTNETIFELTARPARLGVIGAGPIGCELAQTFARLGTEVVLFNDRPHVLPREDGDAAEIVQASLVRDGVELVMGCQIERVERKGDERVLHVTCEAGTRREHVVDQILVGVGRQPNVDGLELETVGVRYDPRTGIEVDDHLRTSNPRVFAAGDVCMAWKFTHAADAAAKIVVQNALFFGRKKLSDLIMPWCTYTDPEVAHVGLYAAAAEERGIPIDTYQVELAKVNRAVCDGEEEGFVKVHVNKGKDTIVGATIVASHAGEMISMLTLAMQHKIGLGALTNVIYPYPTQAECIKAVAGAYTRTRLTPGVKRAFRGALSLRRRAVKKQS